MPIFSIEGNIGSGKSTLLQQLRETAPDLVFLSEPTAEWDTIRDDAGTTVLERYYSDQSRWAFTFQMMAFITRVRAFRAAPKNAVVITERSVFTDREIFAKMLRDSGKMNAIEADVYLRWFDELVGDLTVDGIVYVRTSPEVCEQRIAKRARAGESQIEFEYLNTCDSYHEKWLRGNTVPTLTLNGDVGEASDWVPEVLTFFLVQSAKCFS